MAKNKEPRVQASGSYDPLTGEYSLSIAHDNICVDIDRLIEEELLHIMSCLECLLQATKDPV